MIVLALILATVTTTIHPPAPAVGDLITLEFAGPVSLDASDAYEIVAQEENRVLIRTFQPKPFVVSGTAGAIRFDDLVIPVRSVLKQNDDMQPAPLAPPVPVPYERGPFLLIGAAALAAIAAWALVWFASKAATPAEATLPPLAAGARFRRAVDALRTHPEQPRRWAALADETRRYLAATRPRHEAALTTTELLARVAAGERVVEEILRQGDLEKFDPAGARPRDFDEVAARALALVREETR